MLTWLFLLVKLILGFCFAYFLLFFLGYLGGMQALTFYEKQGIKVAPGARFFVLGNMWDLIPYLKAAKGPETIKAFYPWLMDHMFANGFKPEEHGECVAICLLGKVQLAISNPDMVQDLFVTKNKMTDKTLQSDLMFKDLLGSSFLFGKGDAVWKAKRQACAHAFYKEQLKIMMEVLKGKIQFYFDIWNKEIAASSDKSHTIDITQAFERIFAHNLVTIAFGEDINDQKFDIQCRRSPAGGGFVTKKVSIREALHEINDQLLLHVTGKQMHPLGMLYFLFCGKNFFPNIRSCDKTTANNCNIVRGVILTYILKRKRGEIKSQVANNTDLLSLFLKAPDIFTDDFIVDELMDFFLAGVQTTQFATQTMVSYFSKNPEGLAKVRQQFERSGIEMLKEDASLRGLEKNELLSKIVTLETVQDQEFLNMVMQETLRFQCPASSNTPVTVERETTIGKYTIMPSTELFVNFYGLHYNADHWQRPREFLPERFDKDDPLYLAPNGKKRHAFAYAPFNGGRRVCFGKTFAEATMKILVTYLTSHFNFEHVDEKYRSEYPLAHFGISGKKPPVNIKLTPHNGFKD